VKEEKEKQG
jgi:hypothetical protein